MLYVSSSKTLTFKNASSKNASKESKETKEAPTKKREPATKSLGMKRGSYDSKENICSNIQLAKLVEGSSPIKEQEAARKDTLLFGLKIHKRKQDTSNKQPETVTAAVDLNALSKTKGSFQAPVPKLKIHLKESAEKKGSYDSRRKFSSPPVLHTDDGWNCVNHPDKKAKYELNMGEMETMYCCSKCAISMAAKGYKVKQITNQKCTPERAEILQTFLNKIEELTPKMRSLISTFQRYRLSANTIYQKQCDRHSQYYDSLISQLTCLKRQGESILKESRDKILKQLTQLQTSMKQHLDDTLFMQQQIIPSINLIMSKTMTKLNEEKFNSIMGIYNKELIHFEGKVTELANYRQPKVAAVEGDCEEKLQSCLQSIPYFRLDIRTDEKEEESSQRERLQAPGVTLSNGMESNMYFSFEGPFNQFKSTDKTASKSKSQPKDSQKRIDKSTGLLKQLTGSIEEAQMPTVSVFSEDTGSHGEQLTNSPNFKAT